MRLCCFFNYAPLYRQSIYRKIDEKFDAQFYFGREVNEGKVSGIPKIDYSIFKRKPIEFRNTTILGRFLWRTKCTFLALKKFDTYLITGDFVYSYIPFLLMCRILGKRVYGWGHGIKSRHGLGRISNDFLYRNLTGFFTYSEAGRRRLIELGYPANQIFVIYNSLHGRHPARQNLKSDIFVEHFGNKNPVLIFVGRLTPQKKLDWILESQKKLSDDGISCNLVLVGDGVCMEELKQKAIALDISKSIWFFGSCYDDNINSQLLYNADLCVSPGDVGLTALNAMQFGTPVISHDDFETQMPEYETIHIGKTGALYRKNDFDDFYNQIKKWITSTPNIRELIRQNCYSVINSKWNSDNQLDILEKVLRGENV